MSRVVTVEVWSVGLTVDGRGREVWSLRTGEGWAGRCDAQLAGWVLDEIRRADAQAAAVTPATHLPPFGPRPRLDALLHDAPDAVLVLAWRPAGSGRWWALTGGLAGEHPVEVFREGAALP